MGSANKNSEIVFWNTWYRSSVEKQAEHLRSLLPDNSSDMLLCLSEATYGNDSGLVDKLIGKGYKTAYTHTSRVGQGLMEGLCFASLKEFDDLPTFEQISKSRAIANTKTRWLGRIVFNGISVITSHTSYPSPKSEEIESIISLVEPDLKENMPLVLGGDFNTLINKKDFVNQIENTGLIKLGAGSATCGINSIFGFELDHVFVSSNLLEKCEFNLFTRGPSNHSPLVVSIKN